jgi:hypothetical protein
MTIERMDHVGIVVDDQTSRPRLGSSSNAASSCRVRRRPRPLAESHRGARPRPNGLRADANSDGNARLELIKLHSPPTRGGHRPAPANHRAFHLAFVVEDIDAVVAGLRARGAELVGELELHEQPIKEATRND